MDAEDSESTPRRVTLEEKVALGIVPNKYDLEECDACNAIDDVCLWHEAYLQGQQIALDLIAGAVENPYAVAQVLMKIDPMRYTVDVSEE